MSKISLQLILRPGRCYELKDGSNLEFGKVLAKYKIYPKIEEDFVPETPVQVKKIGKAAVIPGTPDSSINNSSTLDGDTSCVPASQYQEESSTFRRPLVPPPRNSLLNEASDASDPKLTEIQPISVGNRSEEGLENELNIFEMETQPPEDIHEMETQRICVNQTRQSQGELERGRSSDIQQLETQISDLENRATGKVEDKKAKSACANYPQNSMKEKQIVEKNSSSHLSVDLKSQSELSQQKEKSSDFLDSPDFLDDFPQGLEAPSQSSTPKIIPKLKKIKKTSISKDEIDFIKEFKDNSKEMMQELSVFMDKSKYSQDFDDPSKSNFRCKDKKPEESTTFQDNTEFAQKCNDPEFQILKNVNKSCPDFKGPSTSKVTFIDEKAEQFLRDLKASSNSKLSSDFQKKEQSAISKDSSNEESIFDALTQVRTSEDNMQDAVTQKYQKENDLLLVDDDSETDEEGIFMCYIREASQASTISGKTSGNDDSDTDQEDKFVEIALRERQVASSSMEILKDYNKEENVDKKGERIFRETRSKLRGEKNEEKDDSNVVGENKNKCKEQETDRNEFRVIKNKNGEDRYKFEKNIIDITEEENKVVEKGIKFAEDGSKFKGEGREVEEGKKELRISNTFREHENKIEQDMDKIIEEKSDQWSSKDSDDIFDLPTQCMRDELNDEIKDVSTLCQSTIENKCSKEIKFSSDNQNVPDTTKNLEDPFEDTIDLESTKYIRRMNRDVSNENEVIFNCADVEMLPNLCINKSGNLRLEELKIVEDKFSDDVNKSKMLEKKLIKNTDESRIIKDQFLDERNPVSKETMPNKVSSKIPNLSKYLETKGISCRNVLEPSSTSGVSSEKSSEAQPDIQEDEIYLLPTQKLEISGESLIEEPNLSFSKDKSCNDKNKAITVEEKGFDNTNKSIIVQKKVSDDTNTSKVAKEKCIDIIEEQDKRLKEKQVRNIEQGGNLQDHQNIKEQDGILKECNEKIQNLDKDSKEKNKEIENQDENSKEKLDDTLERNLNEIFGEVSDEDLENRKEISMQALKSILESSEDSESNDDLISELKKARKSSPNLKSIFETKHLETFKVTGECSLSLKRRKRVLDKEELEEDVEKCSKNSKRYKKDCMEDANRKESSFAEVLEETGECHSLLKTQRKLLIDDELEENIEERSKNCVKDEKGSIKNSFYELTKLHEEEARKMQNTKGLQQKQEERLLTKRQGAYKKAQPKEITQATQETFFEMPPIHPTIAESSMEQQDVEEDEKEEDEDESSDKEPSSTPQTPTHRMQSSASLRAPGCPRIKRSGKEGKTRKLYATCSTQDYAPIESRTLAEAMIAPEQDK
ncbi:hypothetical protein KM043_015768 [Ampulex compressa]|nr:hypothetical protein KM043_015768 [Ampulex compressa]